MKLQYWKYPDITKMELPISWKRLDRITRHNEKVKLTLQLKAAIKKEKSK